MVVQSFPCTPPFHIADRIISYRLDCNETALAIGFGHDQSLHGLQHFDDFGFFSLEGIYGYYGKKHKRITAQNRPIVCFVNVPSMFLI